MKLAQDGFVYAISIDIVRSKQFSGEKYWVCGGVTRWSRTVCLYLLFPTAVKAGKEHFYREIPNVTGQTPHAPPQGKYIIDVPIYVVLKLTLKCTAFYRNSVGAAYSHSPYTVAQSVLLLVRKFPYYKEISPFERKKEGNFKVSKELHGIQEISCR